MPGINANRAMRPERELILCCTQGQFEDKRSHCTRLITSEDIIWDEVIRLSIEHGVMSIVYYYLTHNHKAIIPDAVLHTMKECNRENVYRNLFLTSQLLTILKILEENDIVAVPYKGPSLSLLAYGDIGLRYIADIDILVQKEDVLSAKQSLLNNGYLTIDRLTIHQERAFIDYDYEFSLYHEKTMTPIELHWSLLQRHVATLDLSSFWQNLVELPLGGKVIKTFDTEHTIVSLCIHGSKHGWQKIEWLYCVASIIRNSKVDWTRLVKISETTGATRMVYLGVWLCQDIFGISLCEEVLSIIRQDTKVHKIGCEIRANVMEPPRGYISTSDIMHLHFFRLKLLPHFRSKIRYCIDLFITPTVSDWSLCRLPSYMCGLYPLLRLFFMIARRLPRWAPKL